MNWISVNERMPDENVMVLVHAHHPTDPVWLGYLRSLGTGDTYPEWYYEGGAPLVSAVYSLGCRGGGI